MLTLGSRVTIDGLAQYARLLQQNPSFDPAFSEIADMRAVTEVALGAEEMLKAADHIDPFSPEAKRAFVVQTPTQAHAARMHKALLSHRNFKVFASVEEAECWITPEMSPLRPGSKVL